MKINKKRKCPGCLTMPTDGFDPESKPPNSDGLIHWCEESRNEATKQELLKLQKVEDSLLN